MRSIILSIVLLLGLSVPAIATQPECTGDRHYDGVGCCPVTTTTLPPQECQECPSCPLPPPCQEVECKVECKDGAPGTTTVVNVDRCPDAPIYRPSKFHKKCKKGDVVVDGKCYRINREGAPRNRLIPESIF